MAELFWLSDEQWQAMAPFMPTNQPGARRKDDRTILSGILHVIKCGCRWKDSRCPSGYTNAGAFCALSARPVPAGFSGTYLDPMKNTYARGAGTVPNSCGTKQNQAGLCYNACPSGSKGVGPVCWNSSPTGYVACGLGCAKDAATCASVISDQAISTVGLVANIVTFGSEHYAQSAESAAKVAKTAEYRPPMPWFNLHAMTEQDLRAMYRFVRSLGPGGEPAPAYVPPGQTPAGPYVSFPMPPG